jgi:hypothetical protein
MFDASFPGFNLFILRAKQLTTKPLGQKANHLKQSTFLINQVLMCIYRKQTFAFAKATK